MSKSRILPILTVFAALFLAPAWLSAQGAGQSALAKATSIRCRFSLMTQSSLHGDQPKAEVKPVKLEMHFVDVNTDEGSAELKSTYGIYDITVRYAQGYLSFIQSFRDGRLHVTTVLEHKTKEGAFKAMHSRHEYTPVALVGFTSSPEQYYGECEIL
jgi:hypothetical protein